VFFGGGTPSLMSPDLVAAILAKVRATWELSDTAEITLEANPTSVEADRFRGYADAGVNRLSMGIQALDDDALRALGRLHTVADATRAFDTARLIFHRVSFDLIYARQNQTRPAWRAELQRALGMAADHLSLYQLTIEPGTAFGARHAAGRLPGLPDDDQAADMYLMTNDICAEAGLPAYEVSNHARPGAEGRHNLVYWRAGDYAGIGPGAHGRLTSAGVRYATEAERDPGAWLQCVEAAGSGECARYSLSQSERAEEYLLMAMRLCEGVDLRRFERLAGLPIGLPAIESLTRDGLIVRRDTNVAATPNGRAVLNHIIASMLPDLSCR
jgi:oxygen-independent coproporphyrinogen-3 oxidase